MIQEWGERLGDWIVWSLWRDWAQCNAELPFKHCKGVAYCMRHEGHRGAHRTNAGERF